MGLHSQKVLLCVWWTAAEIVHSEFLDVGQTITADIYSEQLKRVQDELLKKQPLLAKRKGVVFLQDNARPHVAKKTRETIFELGWEILPHPPYSPDISPSDYHLFLSLDNYMRDRHFKNKEEVKEGVLTFFSLKNEDFYKSGVNKLVSRWQKIVDCDGAYFD